MALCLKQSSGVGKSQQTIGLCPVKGAAEYLMSGRCRDHGSVMGLCMAIGMVVSQPLQARDGQPLTIDNLMVDTNRIDIEMSMSQLELAGLSGQSLLARTQWGARHDLNITASYGTSDWQAVPESKSSYTGLDVTWQVIEEGRSPALLLSASATRIDGPANQHWQMGLGTTLWRSIDPVVLSLSFSGFQLDEIQQEQAAQYGWELAPRVNFSVNPDITLVSGWRYRRGLQTNQSASWGLAWALNADLQMFVEHELDTGAMGGSRFDLRFRYRLR